MTEETEVKILPKGEAATYKAMLSEVETLVRDVGQTDLDLDEMVDKIERGYHLIKAMRARLETTKDQVEQLRVDFNNWPT